MIFSSLHARKGENKDKKGRNKNIMLMSREEWVFPFLSSLCLLTAGPWNREKFLPRQAWKGLTPQKRRLIQPEKNIRL
jgi:hypothetical protein